MKEKKYYSKTGFVSSTSIGYFKKSPKLFKAFIDGEAEYKEESYQGYGKLVHLKLLEPFEYEGEVVPYDYTVPKSPQQKKFIERYLELLEESASPALTAYKEAYVTKESDDKILEKALKLLEDCSTYRKYLKASEERTVIKLDMHDKIRETDKNARAHKKANELLFGVSDVIDDGIHEAYNEVELYYQEGEGGLKYKSMLDRLVINHETKTVDLVDVKTTNDLPNFRESFDKYSYARQLAFYEMMIYANASKLNINGDYTVNWHIVAASSLDSEVKVFNINEEDRTSAKEDLEKTLEEIRWHFRNDRWEHSSAYYNGDGSETL